MEVNVTDCKGGTDTHVFTIVVGSTTGASITVLSPNGGETLVKGQYFTISWTGGYPKVLDSNSVALQLVRGDGSQVGWISIWDGSTKVAEMGAPFAVSRTSVVYPQGVSIPQDGSKLLAITADFAAIGNNQPQGNMIPAGISPRQAVGKSLLVFYPVKKRPDLKVPVFLHIADSSFFPYTQFIMRW